MDIGIFGFETTVSGFTDRLRAARDDGFASFWIPQIFGLDALTAIAVASTEVDGIRMGTAVVPTYPRHPSMLAQQALTVSQVSGGRLDLGIGLSHQMVVEGMWGLSFERPVQHLREYLDVLMPLISDRKVSVDGTTISAHVQVDVEAEPCPVLVAALGTQMLRLAGRRTDGTITWMVGSRTLAEHTVPTITEAAEGAGRPQPRVVAGFPVCVTSEVDAARRRAAQEFAIYGQLPSYRAMLDREGVSGPEDLAVIGDADTVGEALAATFDAGATTFTASLFGSRPEREATWQALAALI
jgi:5,10-methylenetetrahydromethanopterin reductase